MSLQYARWKIEENYHRFSQGIKWPASSASISNKNELIQSYILSRFIDHHIFDMSEEKFQSNLFSQLASLDNILSHQRFIEPLSSTIGLTDLNIFVVIQGLMSDDLSEKSLITNRFEHILRWYLEVDILTR